MKRLLLLTAMFAMMGEAAQASPILYNLTGVNVNVNTGDPGLVVNTQALSLPSPFLLDDGESFTFDLFHIWTDETSLNNDDTVAKPASVELVFGSPASSGEVDGVTDGQRFGLFGLFQRGVLDWSGPVIVTTPWVTYQISLSDESFNAGFLGLSPGERRGATVEATITQIASPPVPEPSTVVMAALAMGPLGLFGLIRRRRAARAQASLGQADSATLA